MSKKKINRQRKQTLDYLNEVCEKYHLRIGQIIYIVTSEIDTFCLTDKQLDTFLRKHFE